MPKQYFRLVICVLLLTLAVFPLFGCPGNGNGNSGGNSPTTSNIVGFQVSTATPTVTVGDTFAVDVVINSGKEMTRGAQCGLVWTPTGAVNCVAVEMGDYYADWGGQTMGPSGEAAIHNDEGKVDQTAVYCTKAPVDQGPSGKGVLFRYQFEALASGTVDFTVDGTGATIADAFGTPIEITLEDVSVTIE